MRVISLESSMTAITFISAPHFGHTKGSTSYTLARRLITGALDAYSGFQPPARSLRCPQPSRDLPRQKPRNKNEKNTLYHDPAPLRESYMQGPSAETAVIRRLPSPVWGDPAD